MVTATVGYKWVGLNRWGVAYLLILQTNFRSFLVLLAVAVSLVATSTIAETGRKAKLLQLAANRFHRDMSPAEEVYAHGNSSARESRTVRAGNVLSKRFAKRLMR